MRSDVRVQVQWAAAAVLAFTLSADGGDCPGAGSCCEPNGTPGCDNEACCLLGCENDPFCCSVEWDQGCVDFAVQNCDSSICIPINDDCENALPIFDGATDYNSTFASDSEAPDLCPECEEGFGLGIGGDIWYTYTATCTGMLTASTCDTVDYDSRLAAYSTCPTTASDLIACNDDGEGCGGFTSILCVPVTMGQTILLRVGGFNGATGTGTINLSCGPACTPVDLSECMPPVVPDPLATGDNSSADGYLRVNPDAYGSWTSSTFGNGGGDEYNPVGTVFGPEEAAFTSGFFLFAGDQRELLSDNTSWQLTGPDDDTLDRETIGGIVLSDSSGDGTDDTADSSFRVFGGTTDLSFGLHQEVIAGDSAQAVLVQVFTITNDGLLGISFDLVRAFDGDLVWVGDAGDDEVGTMTNGGGSRYVVQQEVGTAATAVTISSCDGEFYYGGKQGVEPGNGPPPYDFGTDTEVWDAFGVPGSWENHVAGVGYDSNGFSGAAPPGSTPPTPDAFCGLSIPVTLGPGASTAVTIVHTYGNNEPALGCDACLGDTNGDGEVDVSDLTAVILAWGTDDADADVDGSGLVDVGDLTVVILNWGSCP